MNHWVTSFIVAFLLPSTALAAGGFEWTVHGFYIIDFIIVVGILYTVGKKPIRAYLATRKQTMMQHIDEATALRDQAAAKLEEFETRLADLEKERKSILEGFVSAGEREKAKMIEEARSTADKLVADAEARIHQEGQKLALLLENEAVDIAMTAAHTVLKERMDAGTQKRIIGESIGAIQGLKASIPKTENYG